MPVGQLQYILICEPDALLVDSVAPCAAISGQPSKPVLTNQYVLQPSSQTYFEGLAEGFDYTLASQLYAFGFTGVITLWYVGLISGRIIKAIWG